MKTPLDFLLGDHRYPLPNGKRNNFFLFIYCAVWCMIQYTNYFLLPLIYKRGHLLFANCSIHFHMNKFLVSTIYFMPCWQSSDNQTMSVYSCYVFSWYYE